MNHNDNNHSPEQLLAQGFADHAVAWALESGASADALRLLRRAAHEISLATSEGHVCIMLSDIAYPGTLDSAERRQLLLASGVVGTPDAPGAMPLILDDDDRVYLHRYFDYERRLAHRLIEARSNFEIADFDIGGAKSLLDTLFQSQSSAANPDWQKIAIALALQRRLTIISGGPGTGKTSTVVNLLACLLQQNPACRIALAAPTGKAAARMLDAIRERAIHLPSEMQSHLPTESFTIHRLLGVIPGEQKFRHHAGYPLAIDALVVDEASMLDIALAARLLEAVPTHARIILLGDKDQLSAVEAGAVFSELCADPSLSPECVSRLAALTGAPAESISPPVARIASRLNDCVVWFTKNYRFASDSGIGKLAAHINAGESTTCIEWLRAATDSSAGWIEDGNRIPAEKTMACAIGGYAEYLQTTNENIEDKNAVFKAFERFRILCAVREGPRGVDEINRQVSRHFRQSMHHSQKAGEQSEWYPGRPVIILRNDHVLKLFNGDIGIALPDISNDENQMMVYFPDSDGGFRAISPLRLPEHETAFAMTAHKSQGSEFDSILLLLPSTHSRVLSRELLYTAITRSRMQVTIASNEAVLRQAIESPANRRSGLIQRLQEADALR